MLKIKNMMTLRNRDYNARVELLCGEESYLRI
jgi:hypothetical protein